MTWSLPLKHRRDFRGEIVVDSVDAARYEVP